MTPDTAALRALADAADDVTSAGMFVRLDPDTVRALCDAADEVERLRDANDRLGGMVEWLSEVIVDARDACQRAERIEPVGSPEWVESGIAMRTTALREVRQVLDRERNANPSRYDAARTALAALVADLRALHFDDCGVCPVCTDDMLESVPFPCPTADALDAACAEDGAGQFERAGLLLAARIANPTTTEAAFTATCVPAGCSCDCHRWPGVSHLVACCSQPPFALANPTTTEADA